jgi:divalent metal cation (Fe/Co/Zn/Cd) transporter
MLHGTVRTKHLLAVGAGVQSLHDLRYVTDGPKRGVAFVKLLDADLAVREATNKSLDVKAEPVDGDDII